MFKEWRTEEDYLWVKWGTPGRKGTNEVTGYGKSDSDNSELEDGYNEEYKRRKSG